MLQVKVLTTKPDDPNSVLRTHVVGGKMGSLPSDFQKIRKKENYHENTAIQLLGPIPSAQAKF